MNTWKVLAIIFIIVAVLEFIVLAWAFNYGISIIKNEEICAVEICGIEKYDAYWYDSMTNSCSCFLDGEVLKKEIMK